MKKTIFAILGIVLLLGVLYVGWKQLSHNNSNLTQSHICTMDAKMCPDGSAVGRTGPNCEFSVCPTNTNASPIKTVVDQNLGIQYSYVDNFYIGNKLTKYIHPEEWPPKASVENAPLVCTLSHHEMSQTENRVINGHNYCVTTESEGAAGTFYSTDTYKRELDHKTVSFSFVMRGSNCGNYEEPKKIDCDAEKTAFSIDAVMDQLLSSVTFLR